MTSLTSVFPWAGVLPNAYRRQFATDVADAFHESVATGRLSPLEQTIREWRNTAAIHADEELAASLAAPVEPAAHLTDAHAYREPDRRARAAGLDEMVRVSEEAGLYDLAGDDDVPFERLPVDGDKG